MPQDYAASVQGVSLRITRLDGSGNLLGGPTDSYTSTAFIRVSFTPEYEEGDEITEKNADGTVCVSFKAPDTLKRVTMEIAVCDPDPVLSALLSGGVVLLWQDNTTGDHPGWASAQVGEDPSGDGVAVEVWSRAIVERQARQPEPVLPLGLPVREDPAQWRPCDRERPAGQHLRGFRGGQHQLPQRS